MITVLIILALAFFFDLLMNGGHGMSLIIESFNDDDKIAKSDIEILNEKISELNDDLDYLEDELSDAIDSGYETIEQRIRKKIRTKKEVLSTYLTKLKTLDANTDQNS